jgi:histidinol phosphatase-like PHP family hydrolase
MPEKIIENALSNGYDAVGISDHNYWITGRYTEYRDSIERLKTKYAGKIKVFCGMEVSYLKPDGVTPQDLAAFDYCLFEYFSPHITLMEMAEYRRKFDIPFGLPHFDIITAGEKEGVDAVRLLAENDIFWELNVNHDRAHHYRTLDYVKRFMESPSLVTHAKECGLRVSIGYDTHILEDYDASRVISACRFLEENDIKIPGFLLI